MGLRVDNEDRPRLPTSTTPTPSTPIPAPTSPTPTSPAPITATSIIPQISGQTPTVTAPTIAGQTPTVAQPGSTVGQAGALATEIPRLVDNIGGPGGGIQDYMNPYLQTVMRDGLDEMQRQYAINRQQGAAGANMAGAFGDARHGVWESEAERNFNTQANQFINQVLGQGYESAQALRGQDINRLQNANQFDIGNNQQSIQADAARQMQTALANAGFDMSALTQDQQAALTSMLTNAGNTMQGLESDASRTFAGQQFDVSNLLAMMNADANRSMQLALAAPGMEGQNIANQQAIIDSIMGVGNQQQQSAQQSANLAYLDFLRQQGYPEEQLQIMQSMLSSIPMGQTTTSTSTQSNPSSSPLGAIISMMSLLPWSSMI